MSVGVPKTFTSGIDIQQLFIDMSIFVVDSQI